MTEVSDAPVVTTAEQSVTDRRRQPGGLAGMKLAELQQVAQQLGMSGVRALRKGDLVTAIQSRQTAGYRAGAPAPTATSAPSATTAPAPSAPPAATTAPAAVTAPARATRRRTATTTGGSAPTEAPARDDATRNGSDGGAANGAATNGAATNGNAAGANGSNGHVPAGPDALLERVEQRARVHQDAPDARDAKGKRFCS